MEKSNIFSMSARGFMEREDREHVSERPRCYSQPSCTTQGEGQSSLLVLDPSRRAASSQLHPATQSSHKFSSLISQFYVATWQHWCFQLSFNFPLCANCNAERRLTFPTSPCTVTSNTSTKSLSVPSGIFHFNTRLELAFLYTPY